MERSPKFVIAVSSKEASSRQKSKPTKSTKCASVPLRQQCDYSGWFDTKTRGMSPTHTDQRPQRGKSNEDVPLRNGIILKSTDHEYFVVDMLAVEHLSMLKDMYDVLGMSQEEQRQPLPIALHGKVLKPVVDWCNHHKYDPEPPEDESNFLKVKDWLEDITTPWDIMFFRKINQPMVMDLMMAANYLHVPGLVQMCCKAVANDINGKTTEEIREKFGVVSDFTKQEEAKIKAGQRRMLQMIKKNGDPEHDVLLNMKLSDQILLAKK